jgi:hypothetical protein
MERVKQKYQESPGQALVEFALVLGALLMMIFLIIESARILWSWTTVQNAAREGARYAITGRFEGPDCVVDFGEAKFRQDGGRNVCTDLRVASIIARSHDSLSGLPLNEVSTFFADEYYYNIEVWGANQSGQLVYDFAGTPNNPVIVRVTYQVPIITPFFRPIRESIPVFGQEVLTNESFGSLGNSTGQALPPDLPSLPTPGVTPSPSPTPTASDTPTRGPTETPSATPSQTPIPRCDVQFEGYVVNTQNFAQVTGDLNTTVQIYNLSRNPSFPIGAGQMQDRDGHACDGFIIITGMDGQYDVNDVLAAVSSDGSTDTIIVLGATPTNTPIPTDTPVPTNTSTPTATPTSSPTPSGPYLQLLPACGTPHEPDNEVQFSVLGFNWPINDSIVLLWQGVPQLTLQVGQHTGSFSYRWTFDNLADGNYLVMARSGSGVYIDTETFEVPCDNEPTPTPIPNPTDTPSPADLIVVGPPRMVSTPPIVGYTPVQFSLTISNDGDLDIDRQFFVDVYIDPAVVMSQTIPLTQSYGYAAVSNLAGNTSRVITITSSIGFPNPPRTTHSVYGMVDSVQQIPEIQEENNISTPLPIANTTPGIPPTATATPGGNQIISGGAFIFQEGIRAQYRALIKVIDDSTSQTIATTLSNAIGFYQFDGIPAPTSTYSVSACVNIDGNDWYGVALGVIPPSTSTHIIMFQRPCP